MMWPAYSGPTDHPALARYAARRRGESRQGPAGRFGVALDVWRDGVHLWRSYAAQDAVPLDDWAHKRWSPDLGADYPRDHDNGPWRAPGVSLDPADTVPALSAVQWVGSARDAADIVAACLAIGQSPSPPAGLDAAPNPGALHVAICRGSEGWTTAAVVAHGVTVRALIARCDPPGQPEVTSAESVWTAQLERRPVRVGAIETDLPTAPRQFVAPEGAPPHILARRAKAALGISGHPAVRRDDSLTWWLSRAPYTLTLSLLTREGAQA